MFGFKKKDIAPAGEDKVYMTAEEKQEAMLSDLGSAVHIYDAVMAVAFFHNQFNALLEELDDREIPYRYFDLLHQRYETKNAAGNQMVRLLLLPAEVLKGMTGSFGEEKSGEAAILVAGHHPDLAHDEMVYAFAHALNRKTAITFYQSFDDELLKVFGGERLSQLMTTMGLAKGEAISHPMVSGSIRKAQEKLQDRIVSDLPAASEAEWFKANIRASE